MPKSASTNAPRREGRLSLRVTAQERSLIERAALLASSGDVTRFVITASIDAARRTLEEFEQSRVSSGLRGSLYSLLSNPPPPSARLRHLAKHPAPPEIGLVEE